MIVRPIQMEWHSGLRIYASEPFLKTVSDQYGWIGWYDDSDELLCFLPYLVIKKFIFGLIRFPVQTIPQSEKYAECMEKDFLESSGVIVRGARKMRMDDTSSLSSLSSSASSSSSSSLRSMSMSSSSSFSKSHALDESDASSVSSLDESDVSSTSSLDQLEKKSDISSVSAFD